MRAHSVIPGLALLVLTSTSQAQQASADAPAVPPAQTAPPAQAAAYPAPAAPAPAAPASAPAPAQGGQWMLTPEGRYAWLPGGYELPPVLPYEEGRPVPSGYHLEEEPRRGAVVTGYVLTGVPYGVGLAAAFSSEFANGGAYLAVPWAGPWLTLGMRQSKCKQDTASTSGTESDSDALGCAGDAAIVTSLIIDGILQAVGGTLLLTGYLITSQKLVRDPVAWQILPTRVGSATGLAAVGSF